MLLCKTIPKAKPEHANTSKNKKKKNEKNNWRLDQFTADENAIFGAGRLSLAIGKYQIGHQACFITICD
jgi:hypothetical protein